MNFNINTFYAFHAICTIPKYKIKNSKSKLRQLIPIQWQLILISEGSFTQTLSYLTRKNTKINILQKKYSQHQITNRSIRCVWLETCIYTKLTFARSLWIILKNNKIYNKININKPIGTSFIQDKIDIYKHIHEIYYGYCNNLERDFKLRGPIWGRKYTLCYSNKSSVIIQEFFSPYISHFFT